MCVLVSPQGRPKSAVREPLDFFIQYREPCQRACQALSTSILRPKRVQIRCEVGRLLHSRGEALYGDLHMVPHGVPMGMPGGSMPHGVPMGMPGGSMGGSMPMGGFGVPGMYPHARGMPQGFGHPMYHPHSPSPGPSPVPGSPIVTQSPRPMPSPRNRATVSPPGSGPRSTKSIAADSPRFRSSPPPAQAKGSIKVSVLCMSRHGRDVRPVRAC